MNNKLRIAVLLGLGLGLTACGGSDDNDGNSSSQPPLVANSRVVSGAIQQIDGARIQVNDQWLDLSGAKVQYANDVWAEPLQVGTDVQIVATAEKAETVTLNPLLTGQLAINTTRSVARSWSVNGIPLDQVEAGLNAGDWVMVFGDYDTKGQVLTREVTSLTSTPVWIEVESRIVGLDSTAQTFLMGQTKVAYAGAQIEDGPVQEGRWAEVFGRLHGDQLQASTIDMDDQNSLPDQSEIEGRVQYFDQASGLLELDRQRQVWVTDTTHFKNGSQTNLQVGVAVDVEVKRGNQGIVALEIEFDDQTTPPSTPNQQFKLSGLANWNGQILTINDIQFELDGLTHFEGGLTTNNLDGRWIELDGIVSSGLNLVREIEPDEQGNNLELLGKVAQGKIWGYQATDNSLTSFEGQWADLDCYFDGNMVSNCRKDD